MLSIPEIAIPITEIILNDKVQLFIKREDAIHPTISGNKYWKLFYTINSFLEKKLKNPRIITFGGAFSNHISAVAALGNQYNCSTFGIIRGEELENEIKENPTLKLAKKNGMEFQFVTRESYRNKEKLIQNLTKEFPNALIIEEGGTNDLAVQGIQHMLNNATKDFDYLCTAVGTGGTIAGISKFAEENQQILGFKAVKDESLESKILEFSGRKNFYLVEAHQGKYGKITNETVQFINDFWEQYQIPLEPIYTGKMMMKIFEMIQNNDFPDGSKILAFHTGGLQGIEGANQQLKKLNKPLIKVNY